MDDYIESKVADYERRVYPDGGMSAHSKGVLRDMLIKEDEFWTRFDADHIHGFDDGEPQTQADYNR